MAAMVRAQTRWVVTGTPIGSGGLIDLHGLLRVLQHDPFQDRQLWQTCIARPYHKGTPALHSMPLDAHSRTSGARVENYLVRRQTVLLPAGASYA